MTNEQRGAIEYLKESVLIYKNTIPKISQSIEIVLSLIKEQEEEIDKKDKQIDLMARAIDNYDSQLEINTFKDKEHVKQYFAGLVEKE